MLSFCPRIVLEEIWHLIESVSEVFLPTSKFLRERERERERERDKLTDRQCYTQSRAPGCMTSCAASDGGG